MKQNYLGASEVISVGKLWSSSKLLNLDLHNFTGSYRSLANY